MKKIDVEAMRNLWIFNKDGGFNIEEVKKLTLSSIQNSVDIELSEKELLELGKEDKEITWGKNMLSAVSILDINQISSLIKNKPNSIEMDGFHYRGRSFLYLFVEQLASCSLGKTYEESTAKAQLMNISSHRIVSEMLKRSSSPSWTFVYEKKLEYFDDVNEKRVKKEEIKDVHSTPLFSVAGKGGLSTLSAFKLISAYLLKPKETEISLMMRGLVPDDPTLDCATDSLLHLALNSCYDTMVIAGITFMHLASEKKYIPENSEWQKYFYSYTSIDKTSAKSMIAQAIFFGDNLSSKVFDKEYMKSTEQTLSL